MAASRDKALGCRKHAHIEKYVTEDGILELVDIDEETRHQSQYRGCKILSGQASYQWRSPQECSPTPVGLLTGRLSLSEKNLLLLIHTSHSHLQSSFDFCPSLTSSAPSCVESPPPPNMGCTNWTYYFGFVNISMSHLDVLSFVMGIVPTLGVQYLWGYCKHTKRASKHILGKAHSSHTLEPIPPHARRPSCYPFIGSRPFTGSPPATAPPVPGTAVMAWPSQCNPHA